VIRARDVNLQIDAKLLIAHAAFDVEPGSVVAVLGRNGVGKTTLLRTLAGVRAPDRGSLTIDGREVAHVPPALRARMIAHVAGDDLFLDRLTVRDVVSMGRYPHHRWWQWREEARDHASIDGALQAVHMDAFAMRRFDTLSSGERQRIWLALALAQEARVLLLDEPTSHLDVGVAREILRLLRTQALAGKAVVCVLHDVNEAAEFADRILLLGSQRVLAFDVPERVLTPPLLQAAYGIQMEVLRTSGGALRVFPVSA
jgi:iron complex transport system ATP-binding protein